MTQISVQRAGNGSDKGFRAGDIVRGTEGDGKTWACTTTLLLLYIAEHDVLAVVLESYNPITKERFNRYKDHGGWTLKCRDWQKIGEVSELAQVEPAVAEVVASWHKKI